MKNFYPLYRLSYLILLLCSITGYTQVGINTTNPQGILDINSSIYGVVLPRVELTNTSIIAPIINPQGGTLAIGTVVYNTNTTTNGYNDVVPGIYVWNGSVWFNKFTKKQAEFYTQTTDLRTRSNAGYQNIPGLTSKTFVAEFTGTYKFELSVNYGGGYLTDVDGNNQLTDVGVQSGNFRFVLDGTQTDYLASAYSVTGDTSSGDTSNYYLIWEQYSIVIYKQCTKGQSYAFNLSFDQYNSPGFTNNGNHSNAISNPSNQGTGYIGYDIPCSVEVTYIAD